jgi:hypothetical protein
LNIGNLFHPDEENLLKGLLRQKEIPAIFVREERGKRLKAESVRLKAQGSRLKAQRSNSQGEEHG